MVLISHLVLNSVQLNFQEQLEVHELIQWVINTVRHVEATCHPSSSFAGKSQNMEAILAAASRIKRKTDASTQPPSLLRSDSSLGRSTSSASSPTGPVTPSSMTVKEVPTQAHAALDEHLLRLLYECDTNWAEANFPRVQALQGERGEDIWNEVLTMLEVQ